MSMQVNNNTYQHGTRKVENQNRSADKSEEKKGEDVSAVKKEDSFEKSTASTQVTYKPDMDKVNAMKADLQNNVDAFKKMVQSMISKQGNAANSAVNDLINIDAETRAQAQQAISEDGEWGINKTSERILDFVKAISGGDPDKLAMLKDSVQKGFDAASEAWGGKLPDICQQTIDKVMNQFDEWEKAGSME